MDIRGRQRYEENGVPLQLATISTETSTIDGDLDSRSCSACAPQSIIALAGKVESTKSTRMTSIYLISLSQCLKRILFLVYKIIGNKSQERLVQY